MSKTAEQRATLRHNCTRHLPAFREPTPSIYLRQLADWCDEHDIEHDNYGEGKAIGLLESKIADLLGMPAAAYMPSGVMAQLIALRLHTEAKALPRFGMHVTSHLERHEEKAYQAVFGLQGVLVGDPFKPITSEHLKGLREDLACLIVELPMREIGGQLPTWEDLEALKAATRERHIKLHMDGARLWECRAFYQHSYAEICHGFDSVYVSLYKGIGALAGAVLAGSQEFVDAARVWRRRMGGTIVRQTPMIASAMMRLEQRLAQMDALYSRTLALAKTLNSVSGITVVPHAPQSNMLHLVFDAPSAALLDARDAVAEEMKLWLIGYARDTETPGVSRTELYIGDQALEVSDQETADGFGRLMALARGTSAAG